MNKMLAYMSRNIVLLSCLVALLATATSLALSEVFDLVPCKLCWYQRTFLFSTVFVLAAAEYYKDALVYRFALPLTVAGGLIALYHSLLQWGLVPEGDLTCSVNAACATKHLNALGFITIPFLSLLTFAVLTALMIVMRNLAKRQEQEAEE